MPNYEDYLEHFFDSAKTSIREGKGQELSDNLSHVADLVQGVINRKAESEGQFNSIYSFCRRQYVQLYIEVLDNGSDEDLRSSVINSVSAVANHSQQSNDLEAFDRLLDSLTRCYMQSYPQPGFDDATEEIFERYSTIQYSASQRFEDADNVEKLARAKNLFDSLLKNYRTLWRFAVKHQCSESIRHLDHSLDQVRAFERHVYTPIGQPEDEHEREYLEKKQEIADTFRKRIKIQRFAAYSWAYNLYINGVNSDEAFIEELLEEYAENDFSSVEDLSETYFEIEPVLGQIPYWDQWDTDRQLDNSIGSVMTAMGTNSWIPAFYLAFSLYLFDEQSQDSLSNSTDEELPFPTGSNGAIKLDRLKDVVEEFRNDYPLNFLFDSQSDLDTRINELADTLDRAHSHAKKQQLIRIRNHPLDQELLDSWREELNERFDSSCLLRQALKEIDLLKQKRFPPDTDGIKLSKGYPRRRNFVPEEAVAKSPPSNFREVFEDYRKYILRRLNLEENTVQDIDELLTEIEAQFNGRSPSVILFQVGEHRRRLLDDDRFEHGGDPPNSHYSFNGVPVLTEPTETYTALVLRENESHGVEFVEDEQVLTVTATPGEEADIFDMPNKPLESVPYQNSPHDFVELDIRLRGYIKSEGLDGVLFKMSSDS